MSTPNTSSHHSRTADALTGPRGAQHARRRRRCRAHNSSDRVCRWQPWVHIRPVISAGRRRRVNIYVRPANGRQRSCRPAQPAAPLSPLLRSARCPAQSAALLSPLLRSARCSAQPAAPLHRTPGRCRRFRRPLTVLTAPPCTSSHLTAPLAHLLSPHLTTTTTTAYVYSVLFIRGLHGPDFQPQFQSTP